jgi:nicotinate-nucleotide adenylyltransferase
MRVAFFGGTFDPIHRGHLRLAEAATEAFRLDRVLFAPVGRQPLKNDATAASFADRLAMVAIAVAGGDPATRNFLPSALDAPRPDGAPNYTVDTLAAFADEFPDAIHFALIGADSFLTLPRWHDAPRLLALAQWIVVSRPEFPLSPAFLDHPELAALALTPDQRARIHLLTTVHEDVSATDLRRRLGDGESCAGLLPREVAEYIRSHHLYR